MKQAVRALTEDYRQALREYFEGGGEEALLRAYQIGRSGMAAGLGVLEMAAVHQEALVENLLQMLDQEDGRRVARSASEFFTESLAAFEMSHRGLDEANEILSHLNDELTKRIEAMLHDYRAAQDVIEEQQRMSRLKSEFISLVSHELRTPLTSIHGALGLLKLNAARTLSPRALQLLDVARRNSERLVRLVGEILDLEKIENGTLTFALGPVSVRELLSQAVEANWPFASQHEVRLELGDAPSGAWVRGDFDRLMQVLTNLISNAIKFSSAGQRVEIHASHLHDGIRVSIRDEGPGIPESFRSKIFERFAQADSSVTRRQGGTGLGLSICKVIVERLGGTIGFVSEEGRGATFHFWLPAWSEGDQAVEADSGGSACRTAS